MTTQQHTQIVSFLWSVADDVLRDDFVRGKYRDIILPMTVLRRIDALLEETKEVVLAEDAFLEANGITEKHDSLCAASGFAFYNTSLWTLKSLLAVNNLPEMGRCFEEYLKGFSENIIAILRNFGLFEQIARLVEKESLRLLIEKFTDGRINLSPQPVLSPLGALIHPGLDNRGMGIVYEELLRRFSEANNDEAGEHFTPRDIVRLMVNLVFEPIKDSLGHRVPYRIYDDACGTGGMLTQSQEFLAEFGERVGKTFNVSLYGQEVNPETFAICQSDMLINGDDPANIKYGSTLSRDGHPNATFDFMLSNPPFGKSWVKDYDAITNKKTREVFDPRFLQTLPSGEKLRLIPASSDGQLLFSVNMLSKMKHETPLGSRIAVVHNGSALFTGDAGSGESNIRRWILENDWLEAIIALPLRMFYDTGIATYIWVFANKKAPERAGKVQLIDGSKQFRKLRKNLGDKGHEVGPDEIAALTQILLDFKDEGISKIFPTSEFLYRKITVERPLRLRVDLNKKSGDEKFDAQIGGLAHYLAGVAVPGPAPGVYMDYTYVRLCGQQSVHSKWKEKDWARFRAVCCERDENAEPVYSQPGYFQLQKVGVTMDSDDPAIIAGTTEADPQLRDTENVPFERGIHDYFASEILPHASDAWIDESKTQIGAEISFTKYFYQPAKLRPLSEITREILELETQTEGVLHRLAQELAR